MVEAPGWTEPSQSSDHLRSVTSVVIRGGALNIRSYTKLHHVPSKRTPRLSPISLKAPLFVIYHLKITPLMTHKFWIVSPPISQKYCSQLIHPGSTARTMPGWHPCPSCDMRPARHVAANCICCIGIL